MKQAPLFLILGASGLRQEKALFDAGRLELAIKEVPAGTAPIHWYAGPNGVYLVCSAVGCQSRIAALGAEVMTGDRSQGASHGVAHGGGQSIRGTVVVGGQSITGTMMGPSARSSASAAFQGGHPGHDDNRLANRRD